MLNFMKRLHILKEHTSKIDVCKYWKKEKFSYYFAFVCLLFLWLFMCPYEKTKNLIYIIVYWKEIKSVLCSFWTQSANQIKSSSFLHISRSWADKHLIDMHISRGKANSEFLDSLGSWEPLFLPSLELSLLLLCNLLDINYVYFFSLWYFLLFLVLIFIIVHRCFCKKY